MRVIFIYILSFCLILFGGYRYAHGGIHHNPVGYTAAKHIEKAKQVKFTNTGQDPTTITSTYSSDDKQSVVTVEDDDDDFAFSRKYVLLTNYFIYAAFLIYCCNYFKKRSHVRWQSSVAGSKYIFQGALRI